MRGIAIAMIGCAALIAQAAQATCQSDYFNCLVNPAADIPACITTNAACLEKERQAYLQEQQQAFQTAVTQFYSNPIATDPVLAALFGYDPNFVAASQLAAFHSLAVQSYFARQRREAQARSAELELLLKLLKDSGGL